MSIFALLVDFERNRAGSLQVDPSLEPKHDDVLTVVNHLNQVLTLIQVELRSDCIVNSCIEYLLGENYLEHLCLWTINARK